MEGSGNGRYIPGGSPVRSDPSVSLPIEGLGSLVGGSVCVPKAAPSCLSIQRAHLAIGFARECFLLMGKQGSFSFVLFT